jgi:hypothetical protein
MRKLLATFVLASMMLIALPLAAEAHNGCRRHRRASSRSYASQRYYAPQRYYSPSYYSQGYYRQRPSFYRRHRNLINLGASTGVGALIGAIAGGKRGALIGTGVGAGAGALYTYVIRPKKRRY